MGTGVVEQFAALESAIHTPRAGKSDYNRKKQNLSTTINRLQKNMTRTNNQQPHNWYTEAHKEAQKRIKQLSTENAMPGHLTKKIISIRQKRR